MWLDYNNNGTYDGEDVLVNDAPNTLARQSHTNGDYGVHGKGLMYVWTDGLKYWHLPNGTGTAVSIVGGSPFVGGTLVPNVVFLDKNGNDKYDAGEPAWLDTIVADGLYTHDLQIFPTNPIPSSQQLVDGDVGTQQQLYYYHNDPHPIDTDFDGLEDGDGKAVHGNIPYGERNLLSNPTTIDSDHDALPDGWEVYAGTKILTPDASPGQVQNVTVLPDEDEDTIELLNGLAANALCDPDGDGLVNNQEYFTGLVYEWMHLDIARFPNTKLGSRRPMIWDMKNDGGIIPMRADWIGFFIAPDFPSCPSFDVANGQRARTAEPYVFYHTTKANLADTDGDGMDDFWETYHGLNPLKGAADYMAVPQIDGTRKKSTGAKNGPVHGQSRLLRRPAFQVRHSRRRVDFVIQRCRRSAGRRGRQSHRSVQPRTGAFRSGRGRHC